MNRKLTETEIFDFWSRAGVLAVSVTAIGLGAYGAHPDGIIGTGLAAGLLMGSRAYVSLPLVSPSIRKAWRRSNARSPQRALILCQPLAAVPVVQRVVLPRSLATCEEHEGHARDSLPWLHHGLLRFGDRLRLRGC